MVENRHRIQVNIKSNMFRAVPEVVANDKVIFEVEVWDGATRFPLMETYSYMLTSLKLGGQSVIREGTMSGDLIVFELGTSEMMVPGKVEGTVQIFDENNDRISSAKFDYVVKRDPSLQGSLPADNTSLIIANESLLTSAVEKSDTAIADSSTALTKATTAETTATEVRGEFDRVVAEAGSNNPEVVQARGEFVNLNERLNATSDQLAEKAAKTEVNSLATAKADKTYVDTQIQSVTSGSPKGTYATLADLQTAFPTGNTNIYLVTADGKWYYWSGSAWVAGGVYQSTGIADSAVLPSNIFKDDYTPNLFNKSTVKTGYYLNNSGVEVALASYAISDFIPVIAGHAYQYSAVDNNDVKTDFAGGYYDVNKNWLGSLPGSTNAIPRTWTAPANASFARINTGTNKTAVAYFKDTSPSKYNISWLENKTSNYETKSITLEKLSDDVITAINDGTTISKWNGKTANFLGDSITYGYGLTSIETERFSTLVGNELGLATVNNYGVSGTKIAKVGTDTTNFTSRYSSMANDADIVFVFGGTNDYGHTAANASGTAPFGSFTDRTATTFYGALHVLYSGLINKYLGKKIVVITPTHRIALSGSTGDDYVVNPDTNKNLRDYVNAEREVAEYYGIPVLDLFKSFPFNPNITAVKDAYFPDGLHPNSAGHQEIADAIVNFMNKL